AFAIGAGAARAGARLGPSRRARRGRPLWPAPRAFLAEEKARAGRNGSRLRSLRRGVAPARRAQVAPFERAPRRERQEKTAARSESGFGNRSSRGDFRVRGVRSWR